jgi:hypothetical protein
MKRNKVKQKVKNNLPHAIKAYIWINIAMLITYLVVNVLSDLSLSIKQAHVESAQQINMDYPALGDD